MSGALSSTHLLPPKLVTNLPTRDTRRCFFTIPATVKQILHSLVWQQRVTGTDEMTKQANKSTQNSCKSNSDTLCKDYRSFNDAVSTEYLVYCGYISEENRVS